MNIAFRHAIFLIIFSSFCFTLSSCRRVPGCTDVNAENYDPDAQRDDGSCLCRYLDEIEIHWYNPEDGNGAGWDVLSEADLLLRLAKASSTVWDYNTQEYTNATAPVNMLIFSEVKFTNESWQFQLEDIDNPSADDLMSTGQFNPLTDGENGAIRVTNANIDVSFHYSVR